MAEDVSNAANLEYLSAQVEFLSERLEQLTESYYELYRRLDDVAEMAATAGRKTAKGKKPGALPGFRYWSGKRGRGFGVYTAHRLLRYRKTPTQWARFGGQMTLRYIGAPTMVLSGFSMLITVIWQLWQVWETNAERRREIKEQRERIEERKKIIEQIRQELRLKYRGTIPG